MDRRTEVTSTTSAEQVFPGDSEMARLMRSTDWAQTPLGSVEIWPQPLRTAVNLCLSSRSPIVLWWGPELSVFYNDTYRPSLGVSKHPALGKPGSKVWPEVWPTIGPMLESVMANGESTWSEDQLLPLDRSGFLEEVFFTYSYTPIRLETGAVGGVFCVATETTEKVQAQRRVRAARDLASMMVDAHTDEDVCKRAVTVLESVAPDIPFALLYLLDRDTSRAHLASHAGLDMDGALDGARGATSIFVAPLLDAQDAQALDGHGILKAIARAARTNQQEVVTLQESDWVGIRVRAGRELTPHSALILPIAEPAQNQPSAVLVAGVSPMIALDDTYEGFFELLVSHLSAGLAAARAYEAERRRAEALAEIDRAKTAFFSNVSHEFRTPLTLMLSPLAELLDASNGAALPAPARDELLVVRRNGQRLLKLVNTLLDFSRIEAGRVQARYVPTDLAGLTIDLVSSFRSLCEKAGLRLVTDCQQLAEPVYVDRDMWEKIVLNLLSNAFKFTHEGTITVTLHAVPGIADGGEDDVGSRADGTAPAGQRGKGLVELLVRDTGVGIPAEELPHLFERFHRVEGTRGRSYEGSGIGLALTRELVHLHGGAITVESRPSAGTTFRVTLPLGTAHLPAERVGARASLVSTSIGAATYLEEAERWLPDTGGIGETAHVTASATVDLRAVTPKMAGARIVLADDNADMREYLARLLGEQYRVEAVANGARALVAIARERPDLVLADVMMPEMDGFALLEHLRDDPRTVTLPVILLSARAGEEATLEGLARGADDYLIKPFSARELLSRVSARLEMTRLSQEATARDHELETTFEAIADAVFVYDREGNIVRSNAAARALLELDAQPDYEMLPPAERAIRVQPCDEQGHPIPVEESGLYRLLHGETLTGANALDVRLRLADGRELQVSISGAPLRDEAGAIVGAIAVSRDVTERRALEREAAERASLLEAIFGAVPDRITLFDADGTMTQLNPSAKAIAGPERERARLTEVGRMYDVRTPDGEPVPIEEMPLTRALRGETISGVELLLRDADGQDQSILASTAPYYGKDGRVRGAVAVAHDITEHKKLEQRTHEALEALIAMAEAIVALPGKEADTHASRYEVVQRVLALVQRVFTGRHVGAALLNPAADSIVPLAVVGLTPEIEERWWTDLAVKPLSAYMPLPMLKHFHADEVIELDFGSQPPVPGQDYFGARSMLFVAQHLPDGQLCAVGVEMRDMATFTSQERKLVQAAARLVTLAVERERLTREREEARARELAAVEARRQMDEFLGIASHELRTPLTSVIANVQMSLRNAETLRDGVISASASLGRRLDRQCLLLERTDRQLHRLDRLIGDLLEVSRIQVGKLELRSERCDLVGIVREVVEAQRAAWPERRITLMVPKGGSMWLLVDPDRLGQVVANILSNALKYSATDQPVEVSVRVREGSVRIAVRDRGPGLTSEQQAHLFERFFRVPGIEQQSGSGIGLGLGLYICKTIVERHGGTIGVESAPGAGSTFWFTLPLAASASPPLSPS